MNEIKQIFFILIILGIHFSGFSKEPVKVVDSIKLSQLKDTINTQKDSIHSQLNELKEKVAILEEMKKADVLEWIVIMFMPGSMLIFCLYFLWKFRNSKNFTVSKIIGLNYDSKVEGPTQSTSRFILLMTGLTAIFVVNTLMMYYGYILVFEKDISIPVDDLWKILAGLGIGIVPYGINVWNKNLKEEVATSNSTTTTQT